MIVNDFRDIISEHMDNQPIQATCGDCGAILNVNTDIDEDYDITIEVEPCQYCLDESHQEGYESGVEDGKYKAKESDSQ